MSVGFFETHRDFFAPTSVRDTLYSLPPANLPDVVATRRTSPPSRPAPARSTRGSAPSSTPSTTSAWSTNTLVICTTDHGIAFPGAKATLFDRGIGVMMIMRGPGGFTGGKVIDAPVTHLDVYPTLCELAGVEPPDWLQGASLMPLVRGEVERLHEAIFAETTYHAAYEPQRAVRTERWKYIRRFDDYPHPVLANCDDSASKDLCRGRLGRAGRRPRSSSTTWCSTRPRATTSPPTRPAPRSLAEMRGRLDAWMRETEDPLLDGPVDAAAGRDRQRAVAGLARRPAARGHGGSHGRSIQLRQVQPGTSAPPGSRTLAVAEGAEAAVGGAEVPDPPAIGRREVARRASSRGGRSG